jgi:3'(2'), 5'-bisphosphate nucleotidase
LFWLVDPLDGTKEFIARNDEFTVNIALIEDGRCTLGVIYAPAIDSLYWGGAGLGAFRCTGAQTVAIKVSAAKPGETCRVVASKSHLNEATQTMIERLGDVSLVQAGSSLKFCRVAEGEADIYPRLAPTCEWDTAAAQAVLEGAGGVVLDLQGSPLRYGKPDVLNPSFIATRDKSLIPA